jgi:FixJ family two-component response regulator
MFSRRSPAGTPHPVVFLVDDDTSVREALTSLIRSTGLEIRAFASAQEFLIHARPEVPCCLVLDVRLPGVNGFDLQRMLSDAGDRIPVIFITGHGDIPMTVRAMKAGAAEFLPKPFRDSDLLGAIEKALAADERAYRERLELADLKRRHATLTARERQVMDLVVSGKLNKQSAAALGISQITIKVHRRRIMEKMAAASLAELVRMAGRLS